MADTAEPGLVKWGLGIAEHGLGLVCCGLANTTVVM